MSYDLKTPIPLMSIANLRTFASDQTARAEEVQRLINGANSDLAKIDSDLKQFLSGGIKRINNLELRVNSPADAPLMAQAAERKAKVRTALDEQLRPLFRKMLAAKELASEMATRHWTKPAVLNRATSGAGATDSIVRRSAYKAIFEQAGKAELASWGQLALDTGDAVLADAIYRANSARPKDERGFSPAAFIELLPNSDYTEANTVLQSVMDSADRAGIAISEFEGRTGKVSLNRIAMGLAGQGKKAAPVDDLLDEAGGIRDEALINFAKGRR